MHTSWFKMSRSVFDSDLWHDMSTFRLFMLLIGRATYLDETRIGGIHLKKRPVYTFLWKTA